MLFTHFGVSGPVVLSASSAIRQMEKGRYKLYIDLKPALDESELDKRLISDFGKNLNKNFSNSLGALLPQKMIEPIIHLSNIDPHKKVNEITKQQRRELLSLLKAFPLTVDGFSDINDAIITSGGVSVKEINQKTMCSKLVPGLYFAGEIIDCDGFTGGFNLQIAFSTAYAAASSIIQDI
jgi:predicted Rossmann fold flavoprotein